jgi:hypothetical protein
MQERRFLQDVSGDIATLLQPTVQARRKWIPTNMRENAFSRAASNTLS